MATRRLTTQRSTPRRKHYHGYGERSVSCGKIPGASAFWRKLAPTVAREQKILKLSGDVDQSGNQSNQDPPKGLFEIGANSEESSESS